MSIWFVGYNYWVYKGCFNVINVSVNWVWTILCLTHSAISRLHCHILPKRRYRLASLQKSQMTRSLPHPTNERQQSVNDFCHCVMNHPVGCAVTVGSNRTIGPLSMEQWWGQHFFYVLKMNVNRASMTLALRLGKWMSWAATLRHNRAFGRLSRQNLLQQHRYYILKSSVNRASTTFGLVSWDILGLCSNIQP